MPTPLPPWTGPFAGDSWILEFARPGAIRPPRLGGTAVRRLGSSGRRRSHP